MGILEAALKWAAEGVPVFPCGPNKAPLTKNGHKDASTDPDTIRFMFDGMPEGTLVGAAMGAVSGLFACDFDLYKPGAEDYMRSLIDRGLLNDTQVHLTRSGGLHFIYRSSQQPNCKPAFGVEVKGEGGYVIVPPSPGYSVHKQGINEANPALIEELLRAQKSASSASVDRLKRQVLSGKAFHDPLAQIAARRSAQGWGIERVQQELIDVLKASAASSPSHPRHDRWQSLISDTGEELSRIVGTGNDKYNSNAKTEKVRENISDELFDRLNKAGDTLFTRPADTGDDDTESDTARQDDPSATEDDVVGEWPFAQAGFTADSQRDIHSQRYIAYPLVAERETMLIAGEPKAGKTAITLAIAAAIAQGKSIGDGIQITERRPVLYFALEGVRAVELRLEAMRQDARDNGEPEPDLSWLFVVDRPHNFLEPEQQLQNCAKIALHNAKCKQEFGVPLGWVVLDTLTKSMPGGDQNSVEDTSQVFDLIGKLRTFDVDANIAFNHHLSKQGNVRGSTNIEAEVDVVLGVEKIKDSRDVWLNIRRARSIDDELSYRWSFKNVELGETVQGHKLSAPIMLLQGHGSVPTKGDKVKDDVTWGRICLAISGLGAGSHDISELAAVLTDFVTPPSGKRPNYMGRHFQSNMKNLFSGKHTWAYGDWHMSLQRNSDEMITAIVLRFTG